jgi:hypothetical protein
MKQLKLFLIIVILSNTKTNAQNRSGHSWLFGLGRGMEAIFTDTSMPPIHIKYPNPPNYFWQGHSNICDSATGRLLFSCNGMLLYDSNGVIMENGDSLVPTEAYIHNPFPNAMHTQNSLILPKGSSGHYYVFIATVSDSLYNAIWAPQLGDRAPFDLLMYNLVDINANGGLGKVLEKNKVLLKNVELHKIRMQACRHHNGRDWWLLKQGRYGTNEMYRFLVRPDTILGPFVQTFPNPKYSTWDLFGQMAFSPDGKKLAMVHCYQSELFIADFDRCSGELSNTKIVRIPYDSTTIPNPPPQETIDSIVAGVCFSPNNQFIYVSKWYNIYQYEWNQPDSSLAWYRVQHGPDTTYLHFQNFNSLHNGPDGRIYIGNTAGQFKQMSVIDHPDTKGAGAGFCRKCFRLDDTTLFAFGTPPGLPDFNLGAASGICWPLNSSEIGDVSAVADEMLEVYPNPTNSVIYIKNKKGKKKELYNLVGELLFTTTKDEIEVYNLPKGIYLFRCEIQVMKLVVK